MFNDHDIDSFEFDTVNYETMYKELYLNNKRNNITAKNTIPKTQKIISFPLKIAATGKYANILLKIHITMQ